MRRVLFWLPIVLWLAVEVYLLQGVLFACGGWGETCHGRDCGEISALMGAWGLPISLPVGLILDALFLEGCSTADFIVAALAFCVTGLIQWYFIMRGVESLLAKLYGWLRSMRRDTAG